MTKDQSQTPPEGGAGRDGLGGRVGTQQPTSTYPKSATPTVRPLNVQAWRKALLGDGSPPLPKECGCGQGHQLATRQRVALAVSVYLGAMTAETYVSVKRLADGLQMSRSLTKQLLRCLCSDGWLAADLRPIRDSKSPQPAWHFQARTPGMPASHETGVSHETPEGQGWDASVQGGGTAASGEEVLRDVRGVPDASHQKRKPLSAYTFDPDCLDCAGGGIAISDDRTGDTCKCGVSA